MKVAMVGIHKRFCDESFFEKVYELVQNAEFLSPDLVLLITCNRIEIYMNHAHLEQRHSEIIDMLRSPFNENIEKQFYTFMGYEVLNHLAQVATGLDSLIYGETDIQHQVKKAYLTMGKDLGADGHFLFQKALHISKKVRAEFDIKPVKSLEDQVLLHLNTHSFSPCPKIAFIGNSDLNRRIFQKLKALVNFEPILVTSTVSCALDCFSQSTRYGYDQLDKICPCDAIIGATFSKAPVNIPLVEGGVVIDLSRPKVLIKNPQASAYYDLNYFEKNVEAQALKQYMLKLDAKDYIYKNVKRLQNSRFHSLQPQAS